MSYVQTIADPLYGQRYSALGRVRYRDERDILRRRRRKVPSPEYERHLKLLQESLKPPPVTRRPIRTRRLRKRPAPGLGGLLGQVRRRERLLRPEPDPPVLQVEPSTEPSWESMSRTEIRERGDARRFGYTYDEWMALGPGERYRVRQAYSEGAGYVPVTPEVILPSEAEVIAPIVQAEPTSLVEAIMEAERTSLVETIMEAEPRPSLVEEIMRIEPVSLVEETLRRVRERAIPVELPGFEVDDSVIVGPPRKEEIQSKIRSDVISVPIDKADGRLAFLMAEAEKYGFSLAGWMALGVDGQAALRRRYPEGYKPVTPGGSPVDAATVDVIAGPDPLRQQVHEVGAGDYPSSLEIRTPSPNVPLKMTTAGLTFDDILRVDPIRIQTAEEAAGFVSAGVQQYATYGLIAVAAWILYDSFAKTKQPRRRRAPARRRPRRTRRR